MQTHYVVLGHCSVFNFALFSSRMLLTATPWPARSERPLMTQLCEWCGRAVLAASSQQGNLRDGHGTATRSSCDGVAYSAARGPARGRQGSLEVISRRSAGGRQGSPTGAHYRPLAMRGRRCFCTVLGDGRRIWFFVGRPVRTRPLFAVVADGRYRF